MSRGRGGRRRKGLGSGSRGGSRGGGRRRRRRIRWRAVRRWAGLGGAVLLLAVSMASVVRRGAEARHLSRQVEALRVAERVTLERLVEVGRRADSLASRARIARAAADLGLRPATEEEIVFLEEPAGAAGGLSGAELAQTGGARSGDAVGRGGG